MTGARPTAVVTFVVAFGLVIPAARGQTDAEALRFHRDVRPILSDKCFACHGPDEAERQADLRLDQEADAQRDRGGYAAIVPGDPESSELLKRIIAEDESLRMPPADSGKQLTEREIATLRQWIVEGASYARHWAYVPPVRPPLPAPRLAGWEANPIDRFIAAGLAREGLAPAPPADPVTLVRRIYFDLTGVPPTPEDYAAFASDTSPDAYERLVDRLLASPQFGERMASYWLDLVRYANTVGYHGDQEHAIAPYRDYVISAFNQNMPFDRFTREQLAGDLLENPTLDQLIATGYNRVHQTSHEGGVQVKEYLAKYSADRVRNFGSVWLGSTLACAECHNHKFDPFTQRDFYSVAAFFADIDDFRTFQATDTTPTKREPEIIVPLDEHRARWEELRKEIAELSRVAAAADASAAEVTATTGPQTARLESLRAELQAIEATGRRTMIVETIEPRPIRVLERGDWMDETSPIVEPSTPAFLPPLSVTGRRPTRLDLANWLVSRDNPLTARVLANRLWFLMFGGGLSNSLEDFGNQGEPPVYPELLDWLAVELQTSGWDMKRLLRTIVLSQTYRQSSITTPELQQRDPANRLFARQTQYRLPAEMIRDNMLASSGLMSWEFGGVGARPYQPEGYYQFLNFPKRTYSAHTDRQQYRRAVYMHWQRQFLHPMLKAFDAPTREECTVRRPISNTPLAALTLLNDPSFVEGARALAARAVAARAGDARQQIEWMWQRVLTRPAEPAELEALSELYAADYATFAENPASADQLLAIGLAPVPDGVDRVQLAALTSVARAVYNLNETITRR